MKLRRRSPDPPLRAAPPLEALAGNRRTYEDRWGSTRRIVQVRPDLWRAVARHPVTGPALEIGPGLRPTIPVRGSFFVDISERAASALTSAGGRAVVTGDAHLPFADGSFATVAALEVLEHVERDQELAHEIARVLAPGGLAVVSVPLHMELWSALDDACWHVRRYDPDDLFGKLRTAGLQIERYALSTGRPPFPRTQDRMLTRLPRFTNWSLQHVLFPLETAWRHRFPSLEWLEAGTPLSSAASGITLIARRRAALSVAQGREQAVV